MVFVINSYRETELVLLLIKELDRFYPGAKMIVISDGGDPLPSEQITQYSLHYVHGARLHNCDIGAWHTRWLTEALNCDSDTIIKIDPEMEVLGRLSFIPSADVFGRFYCKRIGHDGWLLKGGLVGLSCSAARRIVSSGILDDEKYLAPRFMNTRLSEKYGCPMYSDGTSFHDVVRALRLSLFDHPEIRCDNTRQKAGFNRVNYKFIHPRG